MSDDAKLDQMKTYYDPHPGFAGAMVPIPGPVKKAAEALDGKTLSLRDAVAALQATTKGQIEVIFDLDYIALRLGPHFFRVIKYR